MANSEFFTYKGKPFVRCGDEIYYGDMNDPYVIRLLIKSKKDVNGLAVADNISITLMSTDPNINPKKSIIKTSEKHSMYDAMDIAEAWLTREIAKANSAAK